MRNFIPFLPLTCLLIALLGFSGGTLLGVEDLNFVDGGSMEAPNTNSPDAFPGGIGKGWISPWEVNIQPKLTQFNAFTTNTKPLSEGIPSCLQMEVVTLTSTTAALTGIWRRFSDNPKQDGIDTTQPYEIQCKLRIDEFSEDFSTPQDSITIRGGIWNRDQGTEPQPPQWELTYRYGLGWLVRSGDGKSSSRLGPTETVLYPDTVYNIRVLISPQDGVLRVELSSSDGDSWQSENVTMTETTSPSNTVGFYAMRIGEDIRMTWSLGGIQVRQSE